MRLHLNNGSPAFSSPVTASSTSFQMEGEFVGFFRDLFGKRRMVLRADGEEVYLKIPKSLRHDLEGKLRAGDRVVVRGTNSPDGECDRRVVFQVSRAGDAQATGACPIRICAKKSCWRSGGKELWRELERRIAEGGLEGSVKLKAVDCLDRCKHGPNAEIPGCEFTQCSPRDADDILSRFTQGPE